MKWYEAVSHYINCVSNFGKECIIKFAKNEMIESDYEMFIEYINKIDTDL